MNKSSFHQSLKFCQNIVAGESTRLGGYSLPPFKSLNLGLYTEDDKETIQKNRQSFFESLGIKPRQTAGSHQVHGDRIIYVSQPGQYEGYDALICNQKGIFLTVTVADCTPVLIYDSKNEAVAAIHAGWKGTVLEIVRKTLEQMSKQFGTNGEDCHAYIGTCIDECSFEVDADVADNFDLTFKRWDDHLKKFFIDLKAANKKQLLDFGIPDESIEVSPFSTFEHNERYFSYRKEKGQTGRMLGVIGMVSGLR
ncbi:MAG: peptidoglycan editing factor PgeF [Bacteroidetes bacterium]|nr:MAG: peptidoglycan editing factor PgeF [Bacteroidota bacterium]